MKKLLLILITLVTSLHMQGQRLCGMPGTEAALIARDPTWSQKLETQRNDLQSIAERYKHRQATTGVHKENGTIPVVFHIVVTADQFAQMGGDVGIARRVDSQIVVLNRDFNAENPDSTYIPSGWKHLYAATGTRFGLAHTDPHGHGTQGYELRIIGDSPGGFGDITANYGSSKHDTSGGLDSWDVTKYLNIWCINFTFPAGLLAATTAKSSTGGTGFPLEEEGICLNYAALGKRTTSLDYFIPTGTGSNYYDQGRTLVHEMGHFFELRHTWGDDGGNCPWSGLHKDDGLADTPPEADSKYGEPAFTIPGGTFFDDCQYDGPIDTQQTTLGVASLDFMNYTDDVAMVMFTTDQAAVIASQVTVVDSVAGENISLVQHPELLQWPEQVTTPLMSALHVFPNPTSGLIYIESSQWAGPLLSVTVSDILGQTITSLSPAPMQNDRYAIDLTGISSGIYFVRCTFATGTITGKILIQ